MKLYCFQLSTGVVFRTTQDIVYDYKGYCIDRQAVTDEGSNISGELSIPGIAQAKDVTNMMFRSKEIVAEWVEYGA